MKWGWIIFWTFVVLFIVRSPAAAAHVAHNIGSFVSNAASSAGTFVSNL